MELPKTIENQFGDIYKIESYQEDGIFILEPNNYAYSYVISSGDFTKFINGMIVPIGIKSKNPQKYIEWLDEYRKKRPRN